jgi:mRNA interferase MazF
MERGDIVRVRLPLPQSPGREQFGTRPAVIVEGVALMANQSTVVVVPLTSQQKALRFPGAFSVQPTAANGLTVPSVMLTNQVRAVDMHRIEAVIGKLDASSLERLAVELRKILCL